MGAIVPLIEIGHKCSHPPGFRKLALRAGNDYKKGMNEDIKAGPACSINSRPQAGYSEPTGIAFISLSELQERILSLKPFVVVIDAEWCTDCRNQMRNLPAFETSLKDKNIEVSIFTAEGPVYDQFVSPAHKELAMKLYSAPFGVSILGDSSNVDTGADATSVMAKRGREGYPAIFFINNGAVQHWSIEDVSPQQLSATAKVILSKLA